MIAIYNIFKVINCDITITVLSTSTILELRQNVQELERSCRLARHNAESHQRERRRLERELQGNAKRHEEGT